MTVRMGMRGRFDGFVTWQRRLEDCEMESDYNCGLLSTLPAANNFFTGPGGNHRKPGIISSATEPTLSVGEHAIWRDTTNSRTLYLYNDQSAGQLSVELS